MKFLVDAQLPRRLTNWLQEAGFETVHTLDLPLGNRTPDSVINDISVQEEYVVITKDADFVSSFHLYSKPYKLLLVSTGNIRNSELEALFIRNIESIAKGFEVYRFIELDKKTVIFHI
jgi:predicted nuclease of predicted toxin-antitoxin system